jgi:glycosyltransferase involved in cell wall biosynthesis
MRIAQIIDTLSWGGVQELQVTLATAAQGSDVVLTLISLRDDQETPYRSRLKELGVPTYVFTGRKLIDPMRIWRIAKFLRQETFDVVHSHLPSSNFIGPIAGRLAGIPVIGSLQVSSFGLQGTIQSRLEAWSLRHAACCVTACGLAVADVHCDRLKGAPIRVIYNAVPTAAPLSRAERAKLRAELVGETDIPLFITVGRLSPEKGHRDLLASVARLRATHAAFRLLIVGGGPGADELASRLVELELEHHVRMLGPRSDVPRLLAAGDVYVSSAIHSEGLSIAMLQAMAAGLSVVTTDVGDSARPVVDGVLVPSAVGESSLSR